MEDGKDSKQGANSGLHVFDYRLPLLLQRRADNPARDYVSNVDDAWYSFLEERPRQPAETFAGWAAARMSSTECDVFGFSSLCGSYPLSLRIAGEVKRRAARRTTLFGGP
jgi:hypothetical protein